MEPPATAYRLRERTEGYLRRHLFQQAMVHRGPEPLFSQGGQSNGARDMLISQVDPPRRLQGALDRHRSLPWYEHITWVGLRAILPQAPSPQPAVVESGSDIAAAIPSRLFLRHRRTRAHARSSSTHHFH